MISNNDFALIAALDLNPIKTKLMHKESGEGWSLGHANAIETEYRRFLYLMKAFPACANGAARGCRHLLALPHSRHDEVRPRLRAGLSVTSCTITPTSAWRAKTAWKCSSRQASACASCMSPRSACRMCVQLRTDGALEAADVQTAWHPAMRPGGKLGLVHRHGHCQGSRRPDRLVHRHGPLSRQPTSRPPGASARTIVKATDVKTAWCIGTTSSRQPTFRPPGASARTTSRQPTFRPPGAWARTSSRQLTSRPPPAFCKRLDTSHVLVAGRKMRRPPPQVQVQVWHLPPPLFPGLRRARTTRRRRLPPPFGRPACNPCCPRSGAGQFRFRRDHQRPQFPDAVVADLMHA
jgi:hypothetical protein